MRSAYPQTRTLSATLGVFFLCLAGCATTPTNPRDTLHNAEAPVDRRVAALQRIASTQPIDSWRDDVARLAFRGGQPFRLRQAAMDAWAQHDPAGLEQRLDRGLLQLQHWEMIEHALGIIKTKRWGSLLPAVLHSYARPSNRYTDEQRSEARAYEAVYGSHLPPFEAVWHLAGVTDRGFSLRRRIAYWSLAVRLDEAAVRRRLSDIVQEVRDGQTAPTERFSGAVYHVFADFGIVPRNREAVLWAMHLRQPERRAYWQKVVAAPQPTDAPPPALRHLVLLATQPPSEAAAPVATRRETTQRATGIARGRQTRVASLPEWDRRLIARIRQALQHTHVRRDLFAQADADLKDDTTEHGGVIVYEKGAPKALAVAPVIRRHDQAYFTPQAAMELLYTGLAHYHFHAQQHDNARHAGPGGGDLEFADNTGAACVVFTFLDRDTLNADFYTQGGVVVDLGHLTRP